MQSTLDFQRGTQTSPNPLIKYYYDNFICLSNYIVKILCVDLPAVADVSSVHIDIESLQNRLLAPVFQGFFFVVAINSSNEANKAAGTCL
jgi:hypothetical protein